jgi:hypothetical protein
MVYAIAKAQGTAATPMSWTERVSERSGTTAMEPDQISRMAAERTPGYRLDNLEIRQDSSNRRKTAIARNAMLASGGSLALAAATLLAYGIRSINSDRPPLQAGSPDPALSPHEKELQAEVSTLAQQIHNNQEMNTIIGIAAAALAVPITGGIFWNRVTNYKNYKNSMENKYHLPHENAPVHNTPPVRVR